MKVVAILSTRYSGSTMLDFMLGSHSRAFSLTELRAFIRNGRQPFQCALCEPPSSCPIWTADFTAELLQTGVTNQLYGAIAERTGQDVIVDSSKIIDGWFEGTLTGLNPADVLCIHICKAPEEYAGSERNKRPGRAYSKIDDIADAWWRSNAEILDWLHAAPFQTATIRYRDLVDYAPAVLAHLLGKIGLNYESGQEHYWNFEHHPLWGNKGSRTHLRDSAKHAEGWGDESDFNIELYQQKHRMLYRDEKWRFVVSKADVDQLYHHPRVAALADVLGYTHPFNNSGNSADAGWTPSQVIGSEAAQHERDARKRDVLAWKPLDRLRRKGLPWVVEQVTKR